MALYISLFFITLYAILIIYLIIGWRRNRTFDPTSVDCFSTTVAIIVACKNEEINIDQLIASIMMQNYPNFQLILVDDHSTDRTQHYILEAIKNHPSIVYRAAVGVGKKNALKEGIQLSEAELIITIDADCLPTQSWLRTIVCFYQKYGSDLIICPIKLNVNNTLFSNLQNFEFTSLVAVGASSAAAGAPILCNGANLAFTREAWEKSKNDLRDNELSGDDIFLLHSVKRRGGKIRFLKSISAFVTTVPAQNLNEFVKQRRRWASKSPSYTDWQTIFTSLVVFLIAVLELFLLLFAVVEPSYLYLFGAFFALKLIVDFIFLLQVKCFFSLENVFLNSFLLSIIYPFYIVFVAASALLFKPTKW